MLSWVHQAKDCEDLSDARKQGANAPGSLLGSASPGLGQLETVWTLFGVTRGHQGCAMGSRVQV